MNRKILWAVLVVGLALIVVPFAMSMPSKTAAGQRMLSDFQPIMQPASVQKTADYYDNVFTNLRPVALALTPATVARFQGYGKLGLALVADTGHIRRRSRGSRGTARRSPQSRRMRRSSSPRSRSRGACNPPLAHRALEAEPDIGVLLPCNVVVYERAGQVHVAAVDPERMLSIVGNDELAPVAADVKQRLTAVVERAAV
jgi:hypothetical protein